MNIYILNLKKTFHIKILLHNLYNMEINHDEIMYWFATIHSRRMEGVNILSEWLRNPGKGTLGS